MYRNISIFFFILLLCSCSRLENKVDPDAYDCGTDKGQMARPILGKDLKSLDASQIEVFSGQDDRTFKKADHLLSPKGCLLPNKDNPTLIRTRDRSMMQVIEELAGTDPIVLETVSLPPLVGICPDLLYTKDQSILFNQILPRGFPTRFGGLLTTDVKLLDHDKVIQEWKSLRVDELQSLKLSDSTSLGRGSYVLQFLQKNFLLDSFDQQYTCKVRVDSSPLQVLLSDAIQDKRRVGFSEAGNPGIPGNRSCSDQKAPAPSDAVPLVAYFKGTH